MHPPWLHVHVHVHARAHVDAIMPMEVWAVRANPEWQWRLYEPHATTRRPCFELLHTLLLLARLPDGCGTTAAELPLAIKAGEVLNQCIYQRDQGETHASLRICGESIEELGALCWLRKEEQAAQGEVEVALNGIAGYRESEKLPE